MTSYRPVSLIGPILVFPVKILFGQFAADSVRWQFNYSSLRKTNFVMVHGGWPFMPVGYRWTVPDRH